MTPEQQRYQLDLKGGAGHFITSQLELDLATVVARLQQLRDEHGEDMQAFLVHRLTTSDLPRLRGHLSPELAAWIDELCAGPERLDRGVQLLEKGLPPRADEGWD
ncbi:MAG: hypothetical protein ACJ786_13290 [Catenulispora sp.]|jgi:hypothetical protein